jgi:hypothetical protein
LDVDNLNLYQSNYFGLIFYYNTLQKDRKTERQKEERQREGEKHKKTDKNPVHALSPILTTSLIKHCFIKNDFQNILGWM